MFPKLKRFLRISPFRLGCVLIVLSCIVFHSFGTAKPLLVSAIDNRVMDAMFRWRGGQPVTGDVVIVDIDEKSLRQIGQWPWPRDVMADLTDRILSDDPAALGFDMVFAERDRTSPAGYFSSLSGPLRQAIPDPVRRRVSEDPRYDHDEIFGQAVSKGPTILGYPFRFKDDDVMDTGGVPFPSGQIRVEPKGTRFAELSLISAHRAVTNILPVARGKSEGFFNVFPDESGTVRRVPLMVKMDGIPYPSLALETCRVGMKMDTITIHASERIKVPERIILGISIEERFIPTDSHARILLNYRGPQGMFDYVPAADVLNGETSGRFRGKFVLVGTSASGLFDLKATPFSNAVPGVEINATVIDNLLKKDPFVYDVFTEIGITYTLIVAGGLVLTAILAFSGPLAGALGAIAFFALVICGNYYFFFLNQKQVGISYPLATCFLILFAVTIHNYFTEGRAKRYIQSAFTRYVSPEVVNRLIRDPGSLSLKGEQRELTVLFCDIRGFTGISEEKDTRELASFMNRYFTQMSRIIMENGGTLDKFIGDAIMAFWGAPEDNPEHAFCAVRTALQMTRELERINRTRYMEDMPEISIGIGINTGLMNVGNFGSTQRFEYTVMGYHVNLASRLEGVNKDYGTTIVISEFTERKVRDRVSCYFLDRIHVRGLIEPVGIYEPAAEKIP